MGARVIDEVADGVADGTADGAGVCANTKVEHAASSAATGKDRINMQPPK